jgi:beta-glucanase (GH16 family)
VAPTGAANDGRWNRLIFQDEFSGTTAKWQRNWRMGNDTGISPPANKSYEAACWDPKNTFVSNGNLVMRAERRSCTDAFGKTYSYATGGATTGSWNFTYGYAEARIFLPADANGKIANFPAWWLNGLANDSGSWPAGGEIDIVEGLSDHINCWHYHWGSTSNAQSAGGCPSTTLVPSLRNPAGWHTYGVAWEPGVLRFYYDGVLVATHTTGVVSSPMYLALDNAVPAQWAPTVPADMLVDYVRVWQR